MKAEIKRQWIEALRSGRYDQGEGVLHAVSDEGRDTFCCLGVLCRIAANESAGIQVRPSSRGFAYGSLDGFNEFEIGVLPPVVMKWAGVDWNDYVVQFPKSLFSMHEGPLQEYSLAELNDEGFTFDQMADVIEYFVPVTD